LDLSPGRSFLHYRLVKKLGAGGMGDVWKAADTTLGRDVALKFLPPSFADDPERLARFEREAKVLASLNHSNIAAVYGLHVSDGMRFLAMEAVPGVDLAERLKRGPMPADEAIDAARQIAEALETAHEQGIVHRDLKPANIKLTPEGKLKVLDFGLAKALETATISGAGRDMAMSPTITSLGTVAGVILGTAAYMSPEQARGKSVDRRADIWAFGCVLYEMLTGQLAFAGETVSDTMAAVLTRDPDWGAIPASTPRRLLSLLRRCLRKDPKERLRDIGDVRVELQEITKGATAEEAPSATTAGAAPRGSVWPVAAGALIVGGLATWAAMRVTAKVPAPPPPLRVLVQAPDKQTMTPEPSDLSMSPDGTTIALVAAGEDGVAHIWLRALGSEQARMVSNTDGASAPFWSPDGRNLGFFSDHKLKRVSINGEGLQTLCATPAPRGAAWAADDTIVFAPTADGPIMAILASGGNPKAVTQLDSAAKVTGHRLPKLLPGGRRFLYVTVPGVNDGWVTKVGSLDGSPGIAVVTADSVAVYAEPGYLVYLSKNNVFARRFDPSTLKVSGSPRAIPDMDLDTGGFAAEVPFSVGPDGTIVQRASALITEHLEVLDREGKSKGKLAAPDGTFGFRTLSPDGRRLALMYTKPGEQNIPIYLLDLARGIFSRFSFDGTNDQVPIWTPDGGRVIWASDRPGGRDLYWKRTDGASGEELLADAPGPFNDINTLTPDGRSLVFTSYGGDTNEDLWIVDLDGKHEPRPLLKTKANELDATISPDGRWMAYRSDESGDYELYARSFPDMEKRVQLTANGTVQNIQTLAMPTLWRGDGREIVYSAPDGRQVMSIPVTPGPTLETGTPVPLFRLPREVHFVTAEPDGQRFVACVANETFSRGLIRIVKNWSGAIDDSK
jgi:Tol biopolymer transport system component